MNLTSKSIVQLMRNASKNVYHYSKIFFFSFLLAFSTLKKDKKSKTNFRYSKQKKIKKSVKIFFHFSSFISQIKIKNNFGSFSRLVFYQTQNEDVIMMLTMNNGKYKTDKLVA